RDGVRVLIARLGLVEDREVRGQGVLERGVDVVGRARRRVGVEELQQVAAVLGEQRDVARFDRRDVRVALADLELALDGVPRVLERLRVDLGDDLVRVVRLRADDDRLAVARTGRGGR